MKFWLLALSVVALDQGTKALVRKKISPGDSVPVLKGKLHVTHVQNRGAAYGLLAGKPRLLLAGTVGVMVYFAGAFLRRVQTGKAGPADKAACALLLGGAFGNLTDRVKRRQVTDFVHVACVPQSPVFNVADAAIFAGAALYALRKLLEKD